MNRILQSTKISPQTVSGVGVAIHSAGKHIGVLYRVTTEQPVQLLHLAWHNALRSDQVKSDYVCWVRPMIREDRAMAIAALCRRIWRQNEAGRVPYGFSAPTQFFDPAGRQLSGPAKIGLTCASFVLAVFDAAGFPLIRYETWPPPSPEDVDRQRGLLAALREAGVNPEHLSACEAEVGSVRYRPEDVAGAGTAETFPTTYSYAAGVGTDILRLLDAIRRGEQ